MKEQSENKKGTSDRNKEKKNIVFKKIVLIFPLEFSARW